MNSRLLLSLVFLLCYNTVSLFKTQHLTEETPTCTKPYDQAYYPGGVKAWAKHVKKHIEPIQPPCESGKVFLSVKVLASGKVDSVKVNRGLCELADNNAMDIVKTSGFWQPECVNGSPVDSWVGIRITYRYGK